MLADNLPRLGPVQKPETAHMGRVFFWGLTSPPASLKFSRQIRFFIAVFVCFLFVFGAGRESGSFFAPVTRSRVSRSQSARVNTNAPASMRIPVERRTSRPPLRLPRRQPLPPKHPAPHRNLRRPPHPPPPPIPPLPHPKRTLPIPTNNHVAY